MGLIKVLDSSNSENEEKITCPQMNSDVVIMKANLSSENLTSKEIEVPFKKAVAIVEKNTLLDYSKEEGFVKYESDNSLNPLKRGLADTIKEISKKSNNDVSKDIYYVNLDLFENNKFGSPSPKKISDKKYGILDVTFFGEYSVEIENGKTLVETLLKEDIKDKVLLNEILDWQFKGKFVDSLAMAISRVIDKKEIVLDDVKDYMEDITSEMNDLLKDELTNKYGMKINNISLGNISLTESSKKIVSEIDEQNEIVEESVKEEETQKNEEEKQYEDFSELIRPISPLIEKVSVPEKEDMEEKGGVEMGFMGLNGQNSSNKIEDVKEKEEASTPSVIDISSFGNIEKPSAISEAESFVGQSNTDFERPSANRRVINENAPRKINFCPDCGIKADGSNYCYNCGYKLK